MFFVKSSFKHTREECKCFRCLIFNLSGPCEFTLFYSLLDVRSSECDVVSLYVVCCSVNVAVSFVC